MSLPALSLAWDNCLDETLRARDLLDEADLLPDGPVKLSVVQEAVRAADNSGDEELMFEARLDLVSASTFAGAAQNTFVAFSWCLHKYRQDPERFAQFEYRLSWQFKFTLSDAPDFPQITLEQIEQLFAEMETFYKQHNHGMRAVLDLRSDWEWSRGNKDIAERLYHQARQEPRDDMTDCHACERNAECWHFRNLGEHERAISHAARLLQRRLTCSTIPTTTYTSMLVSYAKTNRLQEGDQSQATGYRLIRNNPNFLGQIGDQLSYLSFRGKLQLGANMFARHLDWALATQEPRARFDFLSGAKWLFEELQAAARPGRKQTRKLNLPKAFPLYNDRHEYDVTEILAWINAEGLALAKRFDDRNQTPAFVKSFSEDYRYDND